MFESIETYKTELPERYQILEVLGQGGMGVVVKAFDNHLAKPVAIKLVTIDLGGMNLVRFHAEAKILAKLDHVNILTALDFSVTKSNKPFLVLDFLEGDNLEDYIEANGPLPFDRAIVLIIEIISAIHYAHQQSVIHRDIKPSNVILTLNDNDELQAKVVDFGLSKLLQDEQDVTTAGSIIGSPLYMSPEQARGLKVDERADVYSTGCLIYKMITGQAPLEDDSVVAMFSKKLKEKPKAMAEINPDVDFPAELEAIVSKCLEIDPDDRYSSMAELKEALNSIEPEDNLFDTIIDGIKEFKVDSDVFGKSKLVEKIVVLVLFSLLGVLAVTFFVRNLNSNKSDGKVGPSVIYKDALTGEFDSIYNNGKTESTEHFKITKEGKYLKVVETRNHASDKDLQELYGKTKIISMDLRNSEITGAGLNYVDCSKLKTLDLTGAKVNDDGLAIISKFNSIENLSLGYMRSATENGIKRLGRLKNIVILKLPGVKITDNVLKEFSNFKYIKELDLRFSNHFSGAGLSYLKDNKYLWWVSLASPGLTDEIFEGICQLRQLNKLTLDKLTKSELNSAFRKLEEGNITTLDFANCSEFPDRSIESFSKNGNLNWLIFQDSSHVSLGMLKSLRNFENLEIVDFRNRVFTNKDEVEALREIAKSKNLKRISVNFAVGTILANSEKGNPKLEIKFVY